MSSYHILLVEDDPSIALLLQYSLEQYGFVVNHVDTVKNAKTVASRLPFHVAILDVSLPDGNGFDLCRQLRLAGHRQPIIMLTARTQTTDRITGLELGADDYLAKPFEQSELIARINALIRRSYGELAESDQTKLQIGTITLDLSTQRATRADETVHLTTTEFKLLAYLAQNPNIPFSRQQLLEFVWGFEEFSGDARTVDVHVRNLRQKIELDPSQPTLIQTVRGAGYKLNYK